MVIIIVMVTVMTMVVVMVMKKCSFTITLFYVLFYYFNNAVCFLFFFVFFYYPILWLREWSSRLGNKSVPEVWSKLRQFVLQNGDTNHIHLIRCCEEWIFKMNDDNRYLWSTSYLPDAVWSAPRRLTLFILATTFRSEWYCRYPHFSNEKVEALVGSDHVLVAKSKPRLGPRKFGSRADAVDQYVILFQSHKMFKAVPATWQAFNATVQGIKANLSQDIDALPKTEELSPHSH